MAPSGAQCRPVPRFISVCFTICCILSLLFCVLPTKTDAFKVEPTCAYNIRLRRNGESAHVHGHLLSRRSCNACRSRRNYLLALKSKREADYGSDHSKKSNDAIADSSTIRLNKVLKATHSRREADKLIQSGRIKVNGKRVDGNSGFNGVIPYKDVITLDGKKIVGWEKMNALTELSKHGTHKEISIKGQREFGESAPSKRSNVDNMVVDGLGLDSIDNMSKQFEYVKYWKPAGVICTTDLKVPNNIIDEITQVDGYRPKHRVYPVGRLDKDTTGLILLTSDGRIPNSVLRGEYKKPKTYHVYLDRPISDNDMRQLREGVIITTQAQRDGGRSKPLTAATLPAQVERIRGSQNSGITITIVEGRNRQIRKMLEVLHYNVVELHRVGFMGIELLPLTGPGGWVPLSRKELLILHDALKPSS